MVTRSALALALRAFALCAFTAAAASAEPYASLPPGGKYKDCHGYVRHVSAANIRVHCIDGVPKDLSFISYPKFVGLPGGRTMQSRDLKENTPVHVIFSESLGIRHAYKVFVADPKGRGLYGFKT